MWKVLKIHHIWGTAYVVPKLIHISFSSNGAFSYLCIMMNAGFLTRSNVLSSPEDEDHHFQKEFQITQTTGRHSSLPQSILNQLMNKSSIISEFCLYVVFFLSFNSHLWAAFTYRGFQKYPWAHTSGSLRIFLLRLGFLDFFWTFVNIQVQFWKTLDII